MTEKRGSDLLHSCGEAARDGAASLEQKDHLLRDGTRVAHLADAGNNVIKIDWDDEILSKTALTHAGKVFDERASTRSNPKQSVFA